MNALSQKKIWLALAASTLALGGCVTVPVQTTTFDETVLLDAPSSYELPLGPTQVTGSGSYYSSAPRSDWGRYDERYADNYYRDTYGNSGYYAQDAGLDQFAWLDLAYDVTDEIGSNAPDFSFRFDGRQSFAWQTWDGYKLYAEPIAGGYRYYYFGPNSDRPFLVRDPLYSYAYRYGRLVAVYDRDGRILNYNAANRLLGEATYFYRLGREIDSAARYGAGRVAATPLWLTWQNDYDYDRYRWGRDRYRHGDYDDWRRDRRRDRDERGEGRRGRHDRDRGESREERAERLARERDGRDPNRGRPEGVGGAGGRDAAQLPARSTPILEMGRPEGRRVDAETGRPDAPVANQPSNGGRGGGRGDGRGEGRSDGRGAGAEDPAPPAAERPDRPRGPTRPVTDTTAIQAERDAMLQAEAERQALSDERLRQQLEAERQRQAAAAETEAREQQAREANARQRAEQARQAEARRQAEQAAAERRTREDSARQQADLARQREAQQQAEAQRQQQAAEQQARQQEAEQANARLRAQQAREAEAQRRAEADRQAQAQAQAQSQANARAQAERQRQEQQAAAQRQAEAQRQAAQRQADAQREAAQRQAEAQRQAAAAAAAAQRQASPPPQPVVRTAPPPPAPAPATTSTPTPTPAPSSRPATVSRPDRPQREPD